MKRVEIKFTAPIKAVEIIPKGWLSKLLLKVARWEYKLEF
jgi:hypothetical protein